MGGPSPGRYVYSQPHALGGVAAVGGGGGGREGALPLGPCESRLAVAGWLVRGRVVPGAI